LLANKRLIFSWNVLYEKYYKLYFFIYDVYMNCGKPEFKIHGSVHVWAKWQVVIPKSVRDHIWIWPWSEMIVITKNNEAVALIRSEDMEWFLKYLKDEGIDTDGS